MTSTVFAIIGALLSAFGSGYTVAVGRTDLALWCILSAILLIAFVFLPEADGPRLP